MQPNCDLRAGDTCIFGKSAGVPTQAGGGLTSDGICSGDIYAMVLDGRSPRSTLPEFLPFRSSARRDLASMEQGDRRFLSGPCRRRINWKSLAAKEEFALPPLDEQRRIAAVLLLSIEETNNKTLAGRDSMLAHSATGLMSRALVRNLKHFAINSMGSTAASKLDLEHARYGRYGALIHQSRLHIGGLFRAALLSARRQCAAWHIRPQLLTLPRLSVESRMTILQSTLVCRLEMFIVCTKDDADVDRRCGRAAVMAERGFPTCLAPESPNPRLGVDDVSLTPSYLVQSAVVNIAFSDGQSYFHSHAKSSSGQQYQS